MSITAMSAARQITDLPPKEKFVLVALADYANDDGIAWPNIKSLCTWTCMGRSTIIEALNGLVARALIERVAMVRKDGSQTSNNYRLTFVESDGDAADRFFAKPTEVASNRGGPGSGRGGPGSGHQELPIELPEELKSKPSSASPTSSLKDKAAPKEEPAKAQAKDPPPRLRDDVTILVAAWNEHRGVLPSVTKLTPVRTSKLRSFIKTAGGLPQALDILTRATKVVAADDFWRRGKYGLFNLLSKDKVFERAEQYEAKNDSVRPANVSVGDSVRVRVMIGARSTVIRAKVTEVTAAQVIVLDADGLERRVPHRDVVDAP